MRNENLKTLSIVDLKQGLLEMLQAKSYKEGTLNNYRGTLTILESYMYDNGILAYTPVVGSVIVTDYLSVQNISLPGRRKHQRGPCLHCLRHVFAFKSFLNAEKFGRGINDSVPYLSIYLGHDSLKETEKYLKFSSEMYPEAMELFEDYTTLIFPEVHI